MSTTAIYGDPYEGREFGKAYRAVELLGRGELGRLYMGVRVSDDTPVLIRVLRKGLVRAVDFMERFRREVILEGLVDHPSAVQTLDVGEDKDGVTYIVMEHARGRPLKEILAEEGQFPVPRAREVGRQLLEILAAAHRNGVVHQQLRPDNILVEMRRRQPVVRILEFGVANLLPQELSGGVGTISGALYYQSPENAAGNPSSPQSDLYALGVILYEMISGRLPLHNEDVEEFKQQLLYQAPPALSEASHSIKVPKAVNSAVMQALAKDPPRRPHGAEAMREELCPRRALPLKPILIVTVVVVALGALVVGFFLTRRSAADQWRRKASPDHPRYAQGLQLLDEAQARQLEGRIDESDAALAAAQVAFQEAVPYEAQHQAVAEAARRNAQLQRPRHPITKLADQHMTRGLLARLRGDYDEAYRLFDSATQYYRYDETGERAAAEARQAAARDHPAFEPAEDRYQTATLEFLEIGSRPVDLAQASDLFAEAAEGYARCAPYNRKPEEEALEARKHADSGEKEYQELSGVLGDAQSARESGDYEEAYRLFAQARDGFSRIAAQYNPGPESEAMRVRKAADPDNPAYARGEEALAAAQEAVKEKSYSLAYDRFHEARDAFGKAVRYDPAAEQAAERARDAANPHHPSYKEGEDAFGEGITLKETLDYEGARQAFEEATEHFRAARPYDDGPEQAARDARTDAYTEMPVSYAAGEAAFKAATDAKKDYRYEDAYVHFREAARHFRDANFDPATRSRANTARAQADPTAPTYARGEQQLAEAEEAYGLGQGLTATAMFNMAATSFEFAARRPGSPGAGTAPPVVRPPPDSGQSGPDEDRAARRAATRARGAALELKTRCDDWESTGKINRATLSSYEAGNQQWQAGESAMKAKDYASAERSFRAALEAYSKVSAKER